MKKWIMLCLLLLLPLIAQAAEQNPQCSSDDDCKAYGAAAQQMEDSLNAMHAPSHFRVPRDTTLHCVDKKCQWVPNSCGKGICYPNETSAICPQDCPPITGLSCDQIKEEFDKEKHAMASSCTQNADCADMAYTNPPPTIGVNPSCDESYNIHNMTEERRKKLMELDVAYKRPSCPGSMITCRGLGGNPPCIAGTCQISGNGRRNLDMAAIRSAIMSWAVHQRPSIMVNGNPVIPYEMLPKGITTIPKEICSSALAGDCNDICPQVFHPKCIAGMCQANGK